jgi:lipoprotein-anchoring transpeptidase ErfK/SrfK
MRLLVAALCAMPALAAAQAGPAQGGCGEPLAIQVFLDRRGFSPGIIDGRLGANAARALSAFQTAAGLPPTGKADCATLAALDDGEPITRDDVIIEADAAGPFVRRIPADLVDQASLPALGYTSLVERLAEKFHASPALLTRLNPGTAFRAGVPIVVPAVTPFDLAALGPGSESNAGVNRSGVTLEVSKADSTLTVLDASGRIIASAPVTSGSEHDPLPLGEWKVTGISWRPEFRYNPALFWDADPSHAKALIKAGPNNPVGVVWIDINVEHYGLHGTPEPAQVGHTQSHGCVRLTNWDAARVARMVAVGTRVVFK